MTEREIERERLIELIKNSNMLQKSGCHYNDLDRYYNECADYLLENGAIVPPCKVGDEVWINNKYGTIKSKVSNITIIENNKFLVKLHYDAKYCYDNHIETLGYVGYTEENFELGKTVFLTKEEAEKALKGGAEGK